MPLLLTVSFLGCLLATCAMIAGGRLFSTDSKLSCSCRPDKVVVHELVIPASLPADGLPLRVLQSSSGSRPYATKHRPRLLHLDIDTTVPSLRAQCSLN